MDATATEAEAWPSVLAIRDDLDGLLGRLAPPPKLTPSEWADRYRIVSSYSAEPGQWQTARTPYLREIMDSVADPAVGFVVFKKCARIGGTEAGLNIVGYFIDQDPSPILIVLPTVDDAKDFSKEQLSPTIADTPRLARKVSEEKSRSSGNTIQSKLFPGGAVFLVGANSPRGFRRRTARLIYLQEVDGYDASAGKEGDQVKLAINRGRTFQHRRRVYMESTPTDEGSRVHDYHARSDQRRYLVPCPHCGHRQPLDWRDPTTREYRLRYEKDAEGRVRRETVGYVCAGPDCGAVIAEEHKGAMVAAGAWEPTHPGRPMRGYHINALYSPWAGWADLAEEWEEAQGDVEKLKTFVNTALGEIWEDRMGARDPKALEARAEPYAAPVPAGVRALMAGVDVQHDRIEVVVRGFGVGEESWLVARRILLGNPAEKAIWDQLDALLGTEWAREGGGTMRVHTTCVDSGDQTDAVYRYTDPRYGRRIYATKGASQEVPYLVNIRPSRSNKKSGSRFFLTGPNKLKGVIYGRLSVASPGPGCYHFSADPAAYGGGDGDDLTADYFEQLVSEKRVTHHLGGRRVVRWELPRGLRNEVLDCEAGCLAAARLSRLSFRPKMPVQTPTPSEEPPHTLPPAASEHRPNIGQALALQRRFKGLRR